MTITLNALQKQRRDTASNWTSNNTVLLAGEFGYETDTEKLKIGDGSTAWQSLDYLPIPDTNRLLTGNLTVGGNFTVNGTTTTIDTTTLTVEDKNIEIGKVSSPTDTTADGGGISLLGTTTKTINWVDSTDSWTFSEHLDIATGKVFKINNTEVLSATTLGSSVVSSSLTSVGTIATGTWNATAIASSKLAKPIDFADNEKARFGSGNDLQIYHDGSHSRIENSTGNLLLDNSTGVDMYLNSGNDIYIRPQGAENGIKLIGDGAVELYYDNSKKFETTSSGVSTDGLMNFNGTGDKILIGDNGKVVFGGGLDLQIYHDGSHSRIHNTTGKLYIRANDGLGVFNGDGSETLFEADTNGAVELFYDGTKKLETTNLGTKIIGDLFLDNPDHAGSDLQFDSSAKKLKFDDNVKANFGSGDDLQIFHNGERNRIDSANGHPIDIRNTNGVTEYMAVFVPDGSSELFYDGSKKFHTLSTGCYITGSINIQGQCLPTNDDSGLNLGSSSQRWTTVFAANGSINTSDKNEKNTIIDSDLGLDFINKLKPKSYKWNKDDAKTHYGLIAQDLEETLTSLGKTVADFGGIYKEDESPMGLGYSELIAPLIKAVQELSAEVAALKAG